jgi:hypothetical protein
MDFVEGPARPRPGAHGILACEACRHTSAVGGPGFALLERLRALPMAALSPDFEISGTLEQRHCAWVTGGIAPDQPVALTAPRAAFLQTGPGEVQ